jgi:hypothetical protein
MANWFTNLSNAIYREYDRRIKRASLVTEYGAHHDHHDDAHADEKEAIVIANVPHGATIVDEEDDGGVVIANVPRGAVVASPATNDGAPSAENRE